ncbi:MAG: cell division protein ZipA C-terminal FtsZ-binding domain-containing protein [Burkholderiaceae bacterium]
MRLGLIALGALFVLAVWLFNKLQERRLRRSIEGPFVQSRRDVLFERGSGDLKSESQSPSSPGPNSRGHEDRAEPSFRAVDEIAASPAPEGVLEPLSEPLTETDPVELDEAIHALIPLAVEQPVSADRVLASLQGFRHAGRQNVQLLGGREGAWYPLRPLERFDRLLVAIQLANRSGPLNEVEFSEFVTRLESAAEQIPATCHAPDMIETVARARSLDACCAPLDSQIGLTLANPQGIWSGELVAREAEALGMVLRSDGRFHALSEEGLTLFVLQNADGPAFRIDTLERVSTSRVTFLLDLPRAPYELAPYPRMIEAAQAMAQRLSAIIVDDQLKTLTPSMLEAIGRQIEPVYAQLANAGLAAGSPRALTLFS